MSEQIDLTALAFDKGWTLADTGKMYEHNLVAPDFSGPDWGGEKSSSGGMYTPSSAMIWGGQFTDTLPILLQWGA